MILHLLKTVINPFKQKSLATCLLTISLVGIVEIPSTQASPLITVEAEKPEPELVDNPERLLPETPLILSESEAPPENNDSLLIKVKTIEVTGSTVFAEADFRPLIEPFVGQSLRETELQKAADAITQLYLEKGFITSRAILDLTSISTGEIKIQVVEGGLEEIQIEGSQRLQGYVRSRLKLGAAKPQTSFYIFK